MKEGLTFRDVLLVPKYSTITSRKLVDTTSSFSKKIQLKCPIVSANMDTVTEARMAIAMASCGGLGIIHRFLSVEDQCLQVREVKNQNLRVGAAVGATGDYLERCCLLVGEGVDVLVVDVAHGHTSYVLKAVELIKTKWPQVEVVAGNVATALGALDLINAGADGIKVGVGPGSICSTRIVSGAGVPQLTAIMDCAQIAHQHRVPLIADGGIRDSGDITKALAAGASCVMLGSLLAGTEESPGEIRSDKNGLRHKVYRGMASLAATLSFKGGDSRSIIPEGVVSLVPYKGEVIPTIHQLQGGLRSGMSYTGSKTISELWKNAEFIRITNSAWQESKPHILEQ